MGPCKVCKTINFEELPYEEDAGIPHHQSLDALKKSSEECDLCEVIFLSVAELAAVMHLAKHSSAVVEEDMNAFYAALNHKPRILSFTGMKKDSPYGKETLFRPLEGGPHKYKRYEGYWGFEDGEF